MKHYTTNAGDTWDIIAKEVYGSEAYTSFLMYNNQKYVEQYFVFPDGIVLDIPDIPDNSVSALPEWRS